MTPGEGEAHTHYEEGEDGDTLSVIEVPCRCAEKAEAELLRLRERNRTLEDERQGLLHRMEEARDSLGDMDIPWTERKEKARRLLSPPTAEDR